MLESSPGAVHERARDTAARWVRVVATPGRRPARSRLPVCTYRNVVRYRSRKASLPSRKRRQAHVGFVQGKIYRACDPSL